MQQLTLGAAKATIARSLNYCLTNASQAALVIDYINEAQQRLLNRPGKPVGSYQRYTICTNSGCISWPRQIRSIEAWALCDRPGYVRNEWYEYSLGGYGLADDESNRGYQLIDRGTACAFDDITAGVTNRKIRVTTDVAETIGTYLWLYGYDENSNWIRTSVGGSYTDGERIDLGAGMAQLSTNFFSSLQRAVKATTSGVVRLYEYNNTTAAVVKALAYYEPSETLPVYRRSFIPYFENMSSCTDSAAGCTSKAITVMARLQHIPVSADNDFLVIGNLPALKDMVMSLKAAEAGDLDRATLYEQRAVRELDGEMAAYQGDGEMVVVRTEDPLLWGGGGVDNVII